MKINLGGGGSGLFNGKVVGVLIIFQVEIFLGVVFLPQV